ncbi:hypothetical protein GCK72_013746 [Caenorhabditis remanei]|uniref:Uncharacterized protein n=1 Tax=Caenorhabditis remanei TaxID=31234 RepID=A0A6A5GRI8_CAERE|nr:hypothetical protein GCK72_013746 [Caenorhabditis remanei]KAF1757291.1 hypothetical protein GCK72_013746 [Caenorhabditis remanei]
MDRMILEERMLENRELEEDSWNFRWIMPSAAAVGGIAVATYKSGIVSAENQKLGYIGLGISVAACSTVSLGYMWFKQRARAIRDVTVQLERTKIALRKRRQVYFSVSMRMPLLRHPLVLRSCRIAVSIIDCLVENTKILNGGSTWQDLYTDEIQKITKRSLENPEILRIEEIEEDTEIDFEAVFEALITVFKLHASEYSRVVIVDFLNSPKFNLRNFWKFLCTCGLLREFTQRLESLERLALKSEYEKTKAERKQNEATSRLDMKIGWKEQTSMALASILERLESGNVSRSEIELALHKTLVMVGSEKHAPNAELPEKTLLKREEPQLTETVAIENGNQERTDIDLVFEGVSLSDADKQAASKSAVARDVLLDGSESRIHEQSLFGELRMVLEPRRTDFAKRERAALAKFYGVDEKELEKEEEEKNDELFEGVGAGGDVEPEPYDWRKDAENSAGIHQEADNDDFLKALNLRRVEDDIIE